jgi:hypothetical protein
MFNPIEHSGCLRRPERITTLSAWTHHLPVAMALIEAHQPRLLVELGTHVGDSYCAFCQGVAALGLSTQCRAVDTWLGDDHSGRYGDDVFQELCDYHDARYGGFSRLLRMEFDAARPLFEANSIDLLHIDGFHSYEAVRHDFEHWFDTLSDRAIVLFHDILVRDNGFGVWKLWEELSAQYDHFEFDYVHGLGVLLIGEKQPMELKQLAEAARSNQATSALFDALGNRAVLEQTRLRQQEKLDWLDEHVKRLGQQVAAGEMELQERQALDVQRQAHLDHWVAEARRLTTEVQRLNGELERYQQAHYRLLDQFNRLLQKVGPLHRATKAAAQWSVSQAERLRSSPRRQPDQAARSFNK